MERRADVGYSVSVTTRRPRATEQDGRDYYFWNEADFLRAKERGDFAESATVHGNLYGTLRSEVERVLSSGRHVVMDIDVQGARQLMNSLASPVSVFVLPPSARSLIDRLGGRGSESSETMQVRMRNAVDELLGVGRYDYVVVNDDLNTAVAAVEAIIDAEAHRRERHDGLEARIKELVDGLHQRLAGSNGS